MFIYHKERHLPAFISGPALKNKGKKAALIFVAGLGDQGFLATTYLAPLQKRLEETLQWNLVQVTLSSSGTGYGVSSITKDAEELHKLVDYLMKELGFESFALLGFSTGCQDAVAFLKTSDLAKAVKALILLSFVSDREHREGLPETERYLAQAQAMIREGKGNELLPRAAEGTGGAPITAVRFASLAGKNGEDDMFSSDLSDDELHRKLGHIKIPTALVFSVDDEYVSWQIEPRKLAQRFSAVIGQDRCMIFFLENAHHYIEPPQAISRFVDNVLSFLGTFKL